MATASLDNGGVRWIGQQGGRIVRQALPAGWLALMMTAGGGHVVTIADDVRCTDVAAVERHMMTDHATPGIEACRQPICSAVTRWRPSVAGEDEAASSA